MSVELILSIISLSISFITILINLKISRINNTEALHKYEKTISSFELSFKDEAWLNKIMTNGEFNHYNKESQQLIYTWWLEYQKEYKPETLKQRLPRSKKFNGSRFKLAPKKSNNTTRRKSKIDTK